MRKEGQGCSATMIIMGSQQVLFNFQWLREFRHLLYIIEPRKNNKGFFKDYA